MKKIWVYAERAATGIGEATLELLSKAKDLADAYDAAEICAVLLTDHAGDLADKLAEAGADKIYLAEDERLELYSGESYGLLLEQLIKEQDPDIFLFGATAAGSELAPTVAAKIGSGVAAHCVDMRINDRGLLSADVPAFGGKVIGEILIPNNRPQMASAKPGIFIKGEPKVGRKAEIIAVDKTPLEKCGGGIRPVRAHVREISGKPLDEAEIVIAGGYGLGGKENWNRLCEMADLLGGAVGATRPCVDEGWAESERIMIGTSGKSIRPKIYMGFGISGATHHICGMKDSDLIISVNNDENAPIFEVSDYCVAADLNKVIPALLEAIKG